MRYLKRFGVIISAILLLSGMAVVSASAQSSRRVVRVGGGFGRPVARPVIVYRRPFWNSRYYYDPFYDPYFYDPYLRAQRDKYYREKAVNDAQKKINKDQEKFAKDGYISPEEREKMAKNQEKYRKALDKLNDGD